MFAVHAIPFRQSAKHVRRQRADDLDGRQAGKRTAPSAGAVLAAEVAQEREPLLISMTVTCMMPNGSGRKSTSEVKKLVSPPC
eukprot:12570786-Heterocapsa_arctica.AAC.1